MEKAGLHRMSRRKLTPNEKAERKRRRAAFITIFVNGKQKRVPRPPTIEELEPQEFIRRNTDPIWLHQKENVGYGRSPGNRAAV
ncbi:MAG: hypothetical protein ABL878_04520 [Burkholderiales bacterium]